jgi:hypothetical protein
VVRSRLLCLCSDLTVGRALLRYNDPTEPLAMTDAMRLDNIPPPTSVPGALASPSPCCCFDAFITAC